MRTAGLTYDIEKGERKNQVIDLMDPSYPAGKEKSMPWRDASQNVHNRVKNGRFVHKMFKKCFCIIVNDE